MNFYLPIAEISINIYVLLSLGVGIGFISIIFLLTKILSLPLQAARIERIISEKEFL